MSVGRICSRVVVLASPSESIRAAARRMAENDVGSIVAIESNGTAIGVLTDRDIAIRCVAANVDPDKTPISKVMTTPVQSVYEHTPIEEAVSRMAVAATRRLVVTGEEGKLIGILSLDDVLDQLIGEVGSIGRLLTKQQPHITA